jgi:hypothetical protein
MGGGLIYPKDPAVRRQQRQTVGGALDQGFEYLRLRGQCRRVVVRPRILSVGHSSPPRFALAGLR